MSFAQAHGVLDLEPDEDSRFLVEALAAERGRVVLTREQDDAYRMSILPPGVPTLAVEAATSFGWDRYAEATVTMDRFGASAPGGRNMEEFGFTGANVAARARELLASTR